MNLILMHRDIKLLKDKNVKAEQDITELKAEVAKIKDNAKEVTT